MVSVLMMELNQMSITKNTLVIILLTLVAALLIYFYGGPLIDNMVKEKLKITEWPGKNKTEWLTTFFTFSFGVLTGWLLFRRVK